MFGGAQSWLETISGVWRDLTDSGSGEVFECSEMFSPSVGRATSLHIALAALIQKLRTFLLRRGLEGSACPVIGLHAQLV